jgi:polysaccharide export outer membrane protein
MKHPFITLIGLVATVVITATAQGTATPATTRASSPSIAAASTDTAPGLQQRSPRYRLRKGDSFDLDFALSPEFNQTVEVQPDGYVTLKGVGSILVEDQTVPELTETLKTVYAKILHDPLITVALKNFEMPYFIASGQVAKPGKYDLRSDLTVTETIVPRRGAQ